MLQVVEITKIEKHPQAIKLRICTVFDGKNSLQIVCGASNARVGMKTILAPVGATTPRGLSISQAELRGVLSQGMLCSAKDLAVANEAGIVDLPPHIELSTSWDSIDRRYLSSIPWHQYKLVEQLVEDKEGRILSKRLNLKSHQDFPIVSETYFDGQQYRYRNYL